MGTLWEKALRLRPTNGFCKSLVSPRKILATKSGTAFSRTL